jgi:hypothetical protein
MTLRSGTKTALLKVLIYRGINKLSLVGPAPHYGRRSPARARDPRFGAQRMYSSPVSYPLNSLFAGTSAISSAWNAGKSCSAAHRS